MRVYGLAIVLAMSAGLAQAQQLAGSLQQALDGNMAVSPDVQLISHQQYTAMEQRLRDMEFRLASVETEGYSDSYGSGCCDSCNGGGCGNACGCGMGGGCCDNWCNVCPGCTFNAELLFLRSYASEPSSATDTEFETGSRWELGYMNECGRSWRVRYFEFNDPDYDSGNFLDLEYFDVEYAGRFSLGCNWRGEVGAGLRFASVNDQEDNLYDDTIGILIGGQLRGPCFFGLESYGLARHSIQFGKEESSDIYGTFGITELQLGLEYQTCMCGGIGFARGFLEAQQWNAVEDGDSEDVGLFGFGFALGLTR